MEVACSLDEFAQVLAEDAYFNDAPDLPSMLRVFESPETVLDSPESFPGSPCSDEDMARVLEMSQMTSPSLLDSCISDSFVQLPLTHGTFMDTGHVGVTKTRDPCITNAVLHDTFTNITMTSYGGQGKPSGLNDNFSLHPTIFPQSVSINLNGLLESKENDGLNTAYFESTPILSPVSEIDHIQHTPSPQFSEPTESVDGQGMKVDNEEMQRSFHELPVNKPLDHSQNEGDSPKSQPANSTQRRKRKRKSYSKPSKSKKNKDKKSTAISKSQPKPKQVKLSNDRNITKPVRSENIDTVKEHCGTNSDRSIVSNLTEESSLSKPGIDVTVTPSIPCSKEGTTLRRSSRSTRNTENYNFRLSSLVKRVETERRQHEPKQPKGKAKPPPLSKYRRRTANARERDRMKEINDAFDLLKESLPVVEDESKQKMTKFTVLKLALNYISALRDMLGYDYLSSSSSNEGDDPDSVEASTPSIGSDTELSLSSDLVENPITKRSPSSNSISVANVNISSSLETNIPSQEGKDFR